MNIITTFFFFSFHLVLIWAFQSFLVTHLLAQKDLFSSHLHFLLCERLELEYQASKSNLEKSFLGIRSRTQNHTAIDQEYYRISELLLAHSSEVEDLCHPYSNVGAAVFFNLKQAGVDLLEQTNREEIYRANFKVMLIKK